MSQKQKSGGLDIFRIIAALLVISIHTSPFSGISENLDFFVTRIVARVAVPFFFMVTGQYILSDFYNQNRKNKTDASKIWNYIKKLFFMYIISIIIYIPIGIYAGHYRGLDLLGALKILLFDGTFYHLWYFPACIIGVLLVYGMSRWLDIGMMTEIAVWARSQVEWDLEDCRSNGSLWRRSKQTYRRAGKTPGNRLQDGSETGVSHNQYA